MNTPIGGVGYITINGTSFDCTAISHKCSGETREELEGMNGVHGYKPKITVGRIKATLRHSGGVRVEDLNDLVDATVQVEYVNGTVVLGSGVFRNGEAIEVDGEEGVFSIEFAGDVREI